MADGSSASVHTTFILSPRRAIDVVRMPPVRHGRRSSRERARIVCEQCHSRKVRFRPISRALLLTYFQVRCDLQQQPAGVCSNCQRLQQVCRYFSRASTFAQLR